MFSSLLTEYYEVLVWSNICDAANACFCLGPAGSDKMAASHVTQRQLHTASPVNSGEEDVLHNTTRPASQTWYNKNIRTIGRSSYLFFQLKNERIGKLNGKGSLKRS